VHLEFSLTELLKNAFRATVEHHQRLYGTSSSRPLPPVTVTIASSSGITARTPFLWLRIRDQGGGVSPANLPFIFSYAFTTSGRNDSMDKIGDESGGGPYAAQAIGGSAAIGGDGGGDGSLFGEITGKGLQTGMGTLSGLGYGYAPEHDL
jgi:26S proteasome regulatory subunit T1